MVAPHGGAWIEIYNIHTGEIKEITVAPHGGAWIEMLGEVLNEVLDEVAPHGGAWIEITSTARIYAVARVEIDYAAAGGFAGSAGEGETVQMEIEGGVLFTL